MKSTDMRWSDNECNAYNYHRNYYICQIHKIKSFSSSEDETSGNLSGAAIVGIVFLGFVFIILVAIVGYVMFSRRRKY